MQRLFKSTNLILIGIFLFSFSLMIFSAKSDSQTTDEAIHLYSGVTYLQKKDFRLDPEHPPLIKEIAALPLFFYQNLQIPQGNLWEKAANFYYDSWKEARFLGEEFFYKIGNNPKSLLYWGRLPMIFLTLLLGLAGYFWAKKLYGTGPGILAAFLILFLPTVLAHGRLINTDLGLTLFAVLTIYFWGEFLKSPKWRHFLFFGLFLGLALASKFTGIILLPILIILALGKFFVFRKGNKKWWLYLLGFLGAIIISWIVIWASYGFSTNIPSLPPAKISDNLNLWTNLDFSEGIDNFIVKVRGLLFPAEYYKGLFLVGRHALAGHGSFLLGQASNVGWWYYFPAAILFKTPIPLFILLVLAILYFRKIRSKNNFDEFLLLAPPLIYLSISMFSKADLGIRHILPIFPFWIIFASKTANLVQFREIRIINAVKFKLIPALGFMLLILWYLYSAFSSYPNYLAYFNEFAGGKSNYYNILNDSNLDWGQDIYRIKEYIDDHQLKQPYIVYPWDGDSALKYEGINFLPLAPEDREIKGQIIISATYLQMGGYDWLKKYPFEFITPGVLIFNVN